jgi:multicomponent Na+:H+ antiporter subunit F
VTPTALYATAILAILVGALLATYRALKGPESVDRVLAVNVIGTKTVVVIGLIGFLFGRPAFFDLALIYALINFIATIAFLKYLEKGRLG